MLTGYCVRIAALTCAASSGVISVTPWSRAACAATCAMSSSSVAPVAVNVQPGTTSPHAMFFDFGFSCGMFALPPTLRCRRTSSVTRDRAAASRQGSLSRSRGSGITLAGDHQMTTLHVAGLWRYPVKSLAGESLTTAEIGAEGIPGDRLVWVCGPEAVRSSRRHHRLLGLKGTLNADNEALINGYRWDSPAALSLVREAAGSDAWLEESDGLNRFDVLPLLVATDGAVAAFGRDVRRL